MATNDTKETFAVYIREYQQRKRREYKAKYAAAQSRSAAELTEDVRRGREELSPEDLEFERPRTRADCERGIRPCPFVGCRHHLYLDVKSNGALILNFPDRDFDEAPESCALDVAERGELSQREVGEVMNVTKQAVQQLERVSLTKIALSRRLSHHAPSLVSVEELVRRIREGR
jgi:predicted CopG family antitoxin